MVKMPPAEEDNSCSDWTLRKKSKDFNPIFTYLFNYKLSYLLDLDHFDYFLQLLIIHFVATNKILQMQEGQEDKFIKL